MIFFSCAQIGLAQIGLSMWYTPITIPWSVQYPGVFLIFILKHDVVVLSCLSHKVNGSSKKILELKLKQKLFTFFQQKILVYFRY